MSERPNLKNLWSHHLAFGRPVGHFRVGVANTTR